MPIVDLSLPINNKMTGIPSLKLYEDNPTRCVVLSVYGDDHRAQLEAGGFEIAPDAPTVLTNRGNWLAMLPAIPQHR